MKIFAFNKRVLSLLLTFIIVAGVFSSTLCAGADTYYNDSNAKAWSQRTSPWNSYTYNTKTIGYTGCGILSCVNSVNFMHGVFTDSTKVAAAVKEFADYAFSIKAFNPTTSGGGTYRYILFGTDIAMVPPFETKFGEKYNFTMPIYWQENWNYANTYNGSKYNNIYVNNKTALKNYLIGDAVAIAHVPGHFITLADYDPETECFLVLDSASTSARGTTGSNDGVAWIHEDLLSGGRPAITVGGYCVLQSTSTVNNNNNNNDNNNTYRVDDVNYMLSNCDDGTVFCGSPDYKTTASITTTEKTQGDGAIKIVPGGYTGQTASVASMAFIDFPNSQDLSNYDKIYYDLYLSQKISVKGSFQMNFVTGAAAHDGYNFDIDITTLNQGWNTIEIPRESVAAAVGVADWSQIDRLRLTWFNQGGATSGYMIVDNIRLVRESILVSDFEDISEVSTLSAYGTSISLSSERTEGNSSLKMIPNNYIGQNADVASMAFVNFDTPVGLEGYKEIRFDLFVGEKIDVEGRFQINFITGGSSVWDGFNFDLSVGDLKEGWNTIVLDTSAPTDVISSADWSTINRLRFTWFNEGDATSGYFMVDNLRLFAEPQDSEPNEPIDPGPSLPQGMILGDLDMSGEITSIDALVVLHHHVGKTDLSAEQLILALVASLSKEKPSTADSLLILQFSVGKISLFPVEKR